MAPRLELFPFRYATCLELFPFRYRDLRSGKWIRARYVAELHEIKARYAEWEIIGPPEIREISSDARFFTPHEREASASLGNLGPVLRIAAKRARRVTIAGSAG